MTKYDDVIAYGSDVFTAVRANDYVTMERLLLSGVPVDIRDGVISPVPVLILQLGR